MLEANPSLDDEQVTQLCNDGRLPRVATRVVAAMRKAASEGNL